MNNNSRVIFAYVFSLVFLCLVLIGGILSGSATITFYDVWVSIKSILPLGGVLEAETPMNTHIVLQIRLPRVLLAFLVGASLALAGVTFQGLLRNPLADPYTLGASSGAALGAVSVLYFGLSLPLLGALTLPVIAIIAGFITLMLVLLFARSVQDTLAVETIILTGIIFSSFLGALLSLLIALSGDELRQIIHWLLGSVSMRGWSYVYIIFPFFVLGLILLMVHWRELNAFVFGEQSAHHLGINVERKKVVLLLAASLLTGSAVAVSGTIGFVGLVIPHLVRLLFGADHKHLLPLSAIFGGSFLILTDIIARTVIAPAELPIGVITAIIGAPVFGILLLNKKRNQR
ncbi:iron ABC transporter permease [Bacillus shivajii]|nr:iron ABC transporter permease [Bacillus shivajii]UCZ55281.1 iron ABC transporter permease [Bacillus shivajii]